MENKDKKADIVIFSRLNEINFCNERKFYAVVFEWVKTGVISKAQFQKIMIIVKDFGYGVDFTDYVDYHRTMEFYTEGHKNNTI